MVGVSGFEPEASWTRTMRDTKLRHTPMNFIYYKDRPLFCQVFLFSFLQAKIQALPLTKKTQSGMIQKSKNDEGKKIGFSFFQRAGGRCKAAETIQWITGPGVGRLKQMRRAAR